MQLHSLGEERFWPTTLPRATLVQWSCFTVSSSQNNEESKISECLSLIKSAICGKKSFSSIVEASLSNISRMSTFSVCWNFIWAQPGITHRLRDSCNFSPSEIRILIGQRALNIIYPSSTLLWFCVASLWEVHPELTWIHAKMKVHEILKVLNSGPETQFREKEQLLCFQRTQVCSQHPYHRTHYHP